MPVANNTGGSTLRLDRARELVVRPAVAVGLIIAVLDVISLAVTHRAGAVPSNDDWSYVRSALTLHEHGQLHLYGWGQMFLIGQLITAQPLMWVAHADAFTLDVYGAVAMSVVLAVTWAVGRRCVGDRRAVLLVLAVAVWPATGLLTGSFMTDGPSSAASLLGVLLGIVAIRRASRWILAASLFAGLFAFTVREQMVVAIGAVALSALAIDRVPRRFRVEAVGGAVAAAVVCAVLEHVRHGMANADPAPFGLSTLDFSGLPATLLPTLFTIGLAVSPLAAWTLLTFTGRDLVQPGRIVGWLVGLLALGRVAKWNFDTVPEVTLSNYVRPSGGYASAVVGSPPPIMGAQTYDVLQIIAIVGAVVLVGEIGARLARPRALWALLRSSPAVCVTTAYTLLLAGFTTGLAFGGQHQYDRYVLPLLPGFGLLLLRPRRPRPATAAVRTLRAPLALLVAAVVVFLAAMSLDILVSTKVRDAAMWRAAQKFTADGVRGDQINGGLDWNGTHATTATDRAGAVGYPTSYTGQHWTIIFPRSTDCYIVTTTRMHRRTWVLKHRTVRGPYGLDRATITVYGYYRTTCAAVPR